MPDYGSVGGVQAYVRYMTLDAPNNPTSSDVNTWLAARSAQLTAWLAAAGYVTPITADYAAAKAVLDNYANLGAAGLAELSMRSAGASPDSDEARENTFLRQFAAAEAWIKSRALSALGAPQALIGDVALQQPQIGLIVAGTALDTTRAGFPRDMQ